jgi:hypothetical protein
MQTLPQVGQTLHPETLGSPAAPPGYEPAEVRYMHKIMPRISLIVPFQPYSSLSDMFNGLKKEFKRHVEKGEALDFAGTCYIPADSHVSAKGHVQNTAFTVWSVTGYRFT